MFLFPLKTTKRFFVHIFQLFLSSWANLGNARHIPHKQLGHVKVHRTVKIRMEAEAEMLADGKKYVPRPEWDFEPVWVD